MAGDQSCFDSRKAQRKVKQQQQQQQDIGLKYSEVQVFIHTMELW